MSHCLTLSTCCVEYCPVSFSKGLWSKVIIWLDPCVDYRSPSDILLSKVADWRVPAGSMSTLTANYPLLIFTCSSEEAGRGPCNKDTRGLACCQTKATLIHVRQREVIVGNACRSEERRLPLMELPFALEENTGACLQLLWRPAWPPVMGWIWSSFKNVVPFFLLIIDFAYRQHTPLCFTLNSHGVC